MDDPAGLDRGASKLKVYEGGRLSDVARTRLGIASTFGDEMLRRREQFIESADIALDDGIITAEEQGDLDTLQLRNGLSG